MVEHGEEWLSLPSPATDNPYRPILVASAAALSYSLPCCPSPPAAARRSSLIRAASAFRLRDPTRPVGTNRASARRASQKSPGSLPCGFLSALSSSRRMKHSSSRVCSWVQHAGPEDGDGSLAAARRSLLIRSCSGVPLAQGGDTPVSSSRSFLIRSRTANRLRLPTSPVGTSSATAQRAMLVLLMGGSPSSALSSSTRRMKRPRWWSSAAVQARQVLVPGS